jgi:quinol monooxygenase YgiN
MRSISISRASRLLPAAALAIVGFAAPAAAQTSDTVYAVTYLDVSTDWVLQGTGLMKQFRDASRHQAGNLEFSVLQETARPNRFAILEAWKDQAAFDAHAKSAEASHFDFVLEAIRNSPPNQHVLKAFATAAPRGEPGNDAIRMIEHVDFQPAAAANALPAVKTLAEASQKEAGVVRYDILQEPPPHANHYSVVAVWANRAAYDAHEAAAAAKQFRAATVMPARANLYDQRVYKVVD